MTITHEMCLSMFIVFFSGKTCSTELNVSGKNDDNTRDVSLHVTITKVYIARNNIHVELIRFRKYIAILLTLETLKCELGPIVSRLPCLRNWAHYYPGRVATVLCWWRRTFRDMTTSVHAISGHIQFGTQSLRDMPNSEQSHFGICHISRQARFGTG